MPRARHRSMQSTRALFTLSPMSGWLHEHLPEMITLVGGVLEVRNYQLYFTAPGPASGQAFHYFSSHALTLGPHNPTRKGADGLCSFCFS